MSKDEDIFQKELHLSSQRTSCMKKFSFIFKDIRLHLLEKRTSSFSSLQIYTYKETLHAKKISSSDGTDSTRRGYTI